MAEEFNHFADMADKLHKAMGQVVRKTAFDAQALAATNAPKDTGFLANSIYVVTADESSYGRGGASGPEMLPEVEKPDDDLTAYVAVGAQYGVYVEFGTVHMPPQPYLLPAMEAVRDSFEDAMGRLEDKLREVSR